MRRLSVQTRADILRAASQRLAKHGFDAMRMDDVAADVGIGKATLYRYFLTKIELVDALLAEAGRELFTILDIALAVRGCRGRLVEMTRTVLAFMRGHLHLIEALDREATHLFRLFMGVFAEGVARREFVVADLEIVVRSLLGSVRCELLHPCTELQGDVIAEQMVGALIRPLVMEEAA